MFINITLSILDETIKSSPNISETNNADIIDDFEEIFNPLGIRIIYFLLWITYVTLSNAFFALMIMYEKYGEDIMKRSINNRLWSQLGLSMILYNCVCSTISLLRVNFGFLVLAEISVIKALLVHKFSWIVGVNEDFAGRFLLIFNLGYSFVSQTARFVHKFY